MGIENGKPKSKNPMDQLMDASFEMKQSAKMLEKEAAKA